MDDGFSHNSSSINVSQMLAGIVSYLISNRDEFSEIFFRFWWEMDALSVD